MANAEPKGTVVEITVIRCGCGKTEYEPNHQCPKPTYEQIEQDRDGVWRPSS